MPRGRLRDSILALGQRRAYEAFNRRDWPVNMAWFGGGYVFRSGDIAQLLPDMPEEFEGTAGYMQAMHNILDVFPVMSIEFEGFEELAGNRLVSILRFNGEGAVSGAPFEQSAVGVLEFKRGTIVRHTYWFDRAKALRSLGLEPA
jgi:hypothetical protein